MSYSVVHLPKEAFKDFKSVSYSVSPEVHIVEKIEKYDQGILVYEKGRKYPRRGYPYPEAVDAVSYVKRCWTELARMWFLLPFVFPFWKVLVRFVSDYSSFFLERFFLKDDWYCPFAAEILRVGRKLTKNKYWLILVECFAMTVEYDDAYRYPFQDAFGTAGNVRGGLKLLMERESYKYQRKKWEAVYRLSWFFPRIVRKIDREMRWIGLDDVDRSFCYLEKETYNFDGYPLEIRKRIFEECYTKKGERGTIKK